MSKLGKVLGALLLVACAGQPTPLPDDMSAEAHRREADRERQAAREATLSPPRDLTQNPLTLDRWGQIVAEARARHAADHDRAATELERFEAAECRQIPEGERAACPLLVGAGAVVDVEGGVEVRFYASAPVDDIERRMRCHQAYARTLGFASDGCPLFLRGLEIRRVGPRVLRLTVGGDSEAVEQIRLRSRQIVPPSAGVAVPLARSATVAPQVALFGGFTAAHRVQCRPAWTSWSWPQCSWAAPLAPCSSVT